MIQTTVAAWRRRVNAMCCECIEANSLEPLRRFREWSKSVGYDLTYALPSTPLATWGMIHKMTLESIDLSDRWKTSRAWLVAHGFTTQNIWDAVGRGAEARSERGQAFGLRTAFDPE